MPTIGDALAGKIDDSPKRRGKNKPKEDWQLFVWNIGQTHKGRKLGTILKIDRQYVVWAAKNVIGIHKQMAKEALKRRSNEKRWSKNVMNNLIETRKFMADVMLNFGNDLLKYIKKESMNKPQRKDITK